MKKRGCVISIGAIVVILLAMLSLMLSGGVWNPTGAFIVYILVILLYFVLPGGICLSIIDFARRKPEEPYLELDDGRVVIKGRLALRKDFSPESIRERFVTERRLEPLREGTVTERVVTERVLVICPFCGTKNEQGITKCEKCGAGV